MSKESDKVLTTIQIAEFLAVSQETVARWCLEGRLPAFKIGGQWRVRRSDLNRIIQGKVDRNLKKGEKNNKSLF